MKKLQQILNTIMNTSVILDKIYISDGVKTGLSTHELGDI